MTWTEIQLEANHLTFSALSNKQKNPQSIIFLVHGFPDNKHTFDELQPILEANFPGSLILAPSLRGYDPETTGLDDLEYSPNSVAVDIACLIDAVKPPFSDIPVYVVGHDWGALATYALAAEYPEKVTSAVALAIPYLADLSPLVYLFQVPQQLYYSSYFLTMQFESLYRYRIGLDKDKTSPYLRYLWSFWSPKWKFTDSEFDGVCETLSQPGVLRSATAYYRSLFVNFRNPQKARDELRVDFEKVPLLVLGGETDRTMHKRLFEINSMKLKNVDNVKIDVVPRVGHFSHREDPETIATLISNWFTERN